jgi:acyl-coenzyme A synthetase/AMP-(fatty) acid ligase
VELKKKPLHFVETKYLDEMKKSLPAIKIPSHIIYVDKFPLTANGKLDEMQLKEICLLKLSKYLNEDTLARKTRILMHKAIQKKH